MELKILLAAALMALGITAPLPDFLGGMMIGMGACYMSMLFTPPTDRLTLWATLFSGFMTGVLAALAHPHLPWGLHGLPVQLIMALGGLGSRWFGGWIAAFGRGGMDRAAKLPGEIKLPGGNNP